MTKVGEELIQPVFHRTRSCSFRPIVFDSMVSRLAGLNCSRFFQKTFFIEIKAQIYEGRVQLNGSSILALRSRNELVWIVNARGDVIQVVVVVELTRPVGQGHWQAAGIGPHAHVIL